jgi:hypothetical protein
VSQRGAGSVPAERIYDLARVVEFMDIRISTPSEYHKGSVGLSTRLLVMESDGKAAS